MLALVVILMMWVLILYLADGFVVRGWKWADFAPRMTPALVGVLVRRHERDVLTKISTFVSESIRAATQSRKTSVTFRFAHDVFGSDVLAGGVEVDALMGFEIISEFITNTYTGFVVEKNEPEIVVSW